MIPRWRTSRKLFSVCQVGRRVAADSLFMNSDALFMNANSQPLTVFGVSGGAPLLPGDHPAWKELYEVYEGTAAAGDMCTKCSDTWPL